MEYSIFTKKFNETLERKRALFKERIAKKSNLPFFAKIFLTIFIDLFVLL